MKEEAKRSYVLGHSSDEHRRLMLQSRFIGELTESLFVRSGLAKGMSVLDAGCGAGDVSILAAAFVGPSGNVLGLDQSADSIALARERTESAGLSNVRFEVDLLEDLQQRGPFDALVGRLVLLYLQEPAAILQKMAELVRPGGLIVFQEMEMATGRSVPEVPLYTQCGEWIVGAFERAGVETSMGSRLYSIYRQAGLPEPQMISGGRVEGGSQSEIYEWVAQTVRSLLPMIEKTGVATKDEIDVDTLADRLRKEVTDKGGVVHSPIFVGAWACK
jgi:ubiquinone/menaquinone biosynthesis C-methylase UbiE